MLACMFSKMQNRLGVRVYMGGRKVFLGSSFSSGQIRGKSPVQRTPPDVWNAHCMPKAGMAGAKRK